MMDGSPPSPRVILLMDASASMGAVDVPGGPTRLEMARKRAMELVDELRGSVASREVCVVAFAAEAHAVTGFTRSRSVIADAVTGIEVLDQPGNLAEALKVADAIAVGSTDSESEAEPPTTLLVSDGSFRDQGKLPPSVSHLRFERVGPAAGVAPDNIGIVGAKARRDPEDPSVVRVFVDVENSGATGVTVSLAVSIDGAVEQRRGVEVPGAAAAPGRETTIFELHNTGGGVLLVTIGREDALAADNVAGLVLPPARRPSILLVRAGGAASEGLSASTLLEDVLTELRSRSLRVVTQAQGAEILAAGGGDVDLVVYDGVAPVGGVLPSIPTISFGGVPAVPRLEVGEEAGSTEVLFWQRSHPVLRNVALDSVIVAKSRKLTIVPQREGEADSGVMVTELMRGRSGPLMVMTQEGTAEVIASGGGVRHLITGFDLTQSNWPLQAVFPIFLADAVDYLTLRADAAAGRSFKTSEPAEVRVKPGTAGRIALKGPVNLVLREGKKTDAAGAALSAGLLPKAGVYVIEGSTSEERAITANLADEVESALGSPEHVEVAGRPLEGVTGAAAPREVWQWFVMAAAGLLMVEWLVYGRSIRA